MGLDCTLANPESKVDKDGDNEPWNFTRTATIGNRNLRTVDRLPFAQDHCSDGFGSSIRSLNGSTIAELNEWLSALKSWIADNLDTKFEDDVVSMDHYKDVEAFMDEINSYPDYWLVFLW